MFKMINAAALVLLAAYASSALCASAGIPGAWVTLATDGASFTAAGSGTPTVRFGSGNQWTEKIVNGDGQCTAAFFGTDPAPGVVKECQLAVWTKVAEEGQRFELAGVHIVRYGSGSSWIERTLTGSRPCSNIGFHADPIAGQRKECQVASPAFVHPGLLHAQQDLDRMASKVAANAYPWSAGWQKLLANPHAGLGWSGPHAQEIIYRGPNPMHSENYVSLYRDAAAAYALALRWSVSREDVYADKAIQILNAWSSTLKGIDGNSNKMLASGLYGYQLANAGELLRGYRQWPAEDVARMQTMLLQVFYPMNHDFLVRHNGARIDHYWANWDLANMATMQSIGVFANRRDIYDEAVEYFKHGPGNGAIEHVVWKLYPDGLGQVQESGRDQGHTMMDIALLGVFCQTAWNQGDDLFGYDDNRFLRGAEYVAKYNLGDEVPYTPYNNSDHVWQMIISPAARGDVRPIWELIYNHYVVLKGLSAPNVQAFAEKVRVEGGGGDYGPNSGGFDQLGYGTLAFSLK